LVSRKKISEFDGSELVPQWVFDALVERIVPCETPYRLAIMLGTDDDNLPSKGSKKKSAPLIVSPRLFVLILS